MHFIAAFLIAIYDGIDYHLLKNRAFWNTLRMRCISLNCFFPFTLFELWINSEGRNIGISETGNFEPHLYKSYKSLFKALSTRPQKRTKSDFIYCAQCYRPLSRKLDLPLSESRKRVIFMSFLQLFLLVYLFKKVNKVAFIF